VNIFLFKQATEMNRNGYARYVIYPSNRQISTGNWV